MSFYKKKIEEKRAEDFLTKKNFTKLHEQLKYSKSPHENKRTEVPLKQRDENTISEMVSDHRHSQYFNSNTHRQVSGFIAKHYQIPKKEKSSIADHQASTNSVQNTAESFHKRSKSYSSNYVIQNKLKRDANT